MSTEAIQKQMAELQAKLAAIKNPQPKPALSDLLALIGEALTEEEQVWLTANLTAVPSFIASDTGKALVKLLLLEFKTSLSSSTS